MKEQPRRDESPTGLLGRLDSVCDRFEKAWRAEERPRLEDFLPQVGEADRPALLRELLAMEREYRARLGERPDAEEYRRRLPDYGMVVDDVFAKLPTIAVESRPEEVLPAVPGYEILGVLGRGGMGVVYRARQTKLNRIVALKTILAAAHATDEDRTRFLAEAEAIAAVKHPGIVAVHDFGMIDALPYFSLEFCPGGSLDRRLKGGPLLPTDAALLVERLARAIHAAHQHGIVHRDLKPGNVLLAPLPGCRASSSDGIEGQSFSVQEFEPKITDFGLAKRVEVK